MAEKIPMLALSPTMEQGVISQWLKKEGDAVENGEVICEVETDKAVMDYTSMADGVLLKILVNESEDAAVGVPIAIIGEEGEEVDASMLEESVPPPSASTSVEEEEDDEDIQMLSPAISRPSPGGKVRATPAARGLAAERGVELSGLQGSGPNGRVVLADVEAAVAAGKGGRPTFVQSAPSVAGGSMVPVLENDTVIPLTEKRKIIAQRLAESKFSAPHFYLKLSAQMDDILDLRKRLNGMREEKLSLNAFLIKMVAQALKLNLTVNSSWNGDTVVEHQQVDIALAVAVDGGLITPVVRDCGSKNIVAIDADLQDLIVRAKAGKLKPEEYTNSTFTISNLGSYGIEDFTAIINPPNSAILAVGKTQKKAVVGDDDSIIIQSLMTMSLSCDHRVIDGAVGATFMADLKNMLEQPSLALA